MGLNLPGMTQIFKHSAEFDQGGGNIRIGMAKIVVALDGTGDTDSIQEGIDMLPGGGGAVYIKEGVYPITLPILISGSNIALIGAGWATRIHFVTDINGITISGGQNYLIKDLFLNGSDNAAHTNNIGINSTSSLTRIEGCKFFQIGYNAIKIGSGRILNTITNNYISSKDDCIRFLGTGECLIAENHISGGVDGISLEGSSDDNIIVNNTFASQSGVGINITVNTCDKNLIMGNNCQTGITDNGTNTHPNGASGTTNLQLDDLNIII